MRSKLKQILDYLTSHRRKIAKGFLIILLVVIIRWAFYTPNPPLIISGIVWILFLIYWVGAIVKEKELRKKWRWQPFYLYLVLAAAILYYFQVFLSLPAWSYLAVVTQNVWLSILGLILCALGLLFEAKIIRISHEASQEIDRSKTDSTHAGILLALCGTVLIVGEVYGLIVLLPAILWVTPRPRKTKLPFSVALMIVAALIISHAIPYITNEKSDSVSLPREYSIPLPPNNPIGLSYITLQLNFVSQNAFIAGNPINVTYNFLGQIPNVYVFQIHLIGAEQPDVQPNPFTQQDFQQIIQNQLAAEIIATGTLVFTPNPAFHEHGPTTYSFSGEKDNVRYDDSGSFGIGFSLVTTSGTRLGYDYGDQGYEIPNVINISPPENLLTIQSNNLIIGLAWITIAVAFLLSGLSAFIDCL